ncbi:DegT/DnrJ/EryC1/StrS family aminotransferase [Roseivirga sp.]|uniref:DegT/DnrJ/EryC1/StrS family aminotransferase n=1 Tax=Roseivirga sp. TaxID=1964215 RepID=UPI003B517CB9
MRVPYLDLKALHDPIQDELNAIFHQVLGESYFVYGQQVTDFEKAFARRLGIDHCLAVGNCTDALFITLKMMGIGEGDEVIVPAMTWITDAEVVSNLGAQPVFVDVDPQTYTLDVSQIEEKLTSRTKAIIPVHLYWQMADMMAIMEMAEVHDLKVIEDCAQSHFAQSHGRLAGTFGHAAVFSFYPTKNMGALGDAGCMVTHDERLYLDCRKWANHGAADKHSHEFPGGNSRMDTLQAAVLLLKLKYIDGWNKERVMLAERYGKSFSVLNDIETPKTDSENEHVFHVYNVLTKERDSLKKFLKEEGIQTQVHYPKALPFTKAYAYLGSKASDFPVAYRMQEEGLSLPIFPGMEKSQQDYVIEKVMRFYGI